MKTRIISGFVLAILLVAAVFSGQIVFGIAVFALSVIGIYEFYNSVSNAGYKPIKLFGYLACIPVLLLGMDGKIKAVSDFIDSFQKGNYLGVLIFLLIVLLSTSIIFLYKRFNLIDISLTAYGIIYVVYLFSFVVLTRNMDHGVYLIWLIFIGAFATDTSAYFTGVAIGKTKILPVISPKKSLEGSIGGVLGCILITCMYGFFLKDSIPDLDVRFYDFAILGLLCGIISQIGDWTASAIKRYVKVKDYGSLMPGHGGVLDRFDSILFVAPVIYFYINLFVY